MYLKLISLNKFCFTIETITHATVVDIGFDEKEYYVTEGVNDTAAVYVALLGGEPLNRTVSFTITTHDSSALGGEYNITISSRLGFNKLC